MTDMENGRYKIGQVAIPNYSGSIRSIMTDVVLFHNGWYLTNP